LSEGRLYRVPAADGVSIALHRLTPDRACGEPVLLAPGTFSMRSLWLGTRGHGLGRTLADAGFDTWILEARGHGAADRPRSWRMSDWIRLDAPAAVGAVLRETGAERVVWVGHSAGGVVGAAFAGAGTDEAARLGGLVLLGAPGPRHMSWSRRAGARLSHTAAVLLPWARIPGPLIGMGPESEPAALVREWMGWNLYESWRGRDGDYLDGLASVSAPLLAIGGAGDRILAPPVAIHDLAARFGSRDRKVVIAGRATGFRRNYGHAELVASRAAREEIWPLVLAWLDDHDGRTEAEVMT
jgi:predicted alpha/beta hydrolase